MSFYDNYVYLCSEIGKSPSAVAEELKLGKPSVTRWKHGSQPRDSTVFKIAAYFGISVAELLNGKKETADPKVGGGGESLEDIIPGYDLLTEQNKARLRDYAAVLLAAQRSK